MVDSTLFDKLEALTDLETAVLLCIIAREHCIIDTERDALEDLENELILIAENLFGLSYATIHCSSDLSLEEFNHAILSRDQWDTSPSRRKYNARLGHPYGSNQVPNVVIMRGFDQAPDEIQLHVLEILRSRQISMRHDSYSVPDTFVLIPLLSANGMPLSSLLNRHLNDHIFISHYHDVKDGFMNLEDDTGWLAENQSSESSVYSNVYPSLANNPNSRLVQYEDIRALRQLADTATVSPDIYCYLHNIVVFLRLTRSVAGGITASATRHFELLSRCLAPLQQMDYVCPSLVATAARKVYRHRILLSKPEDDRSILYGSNLKAVGLLLADATAENTIERVLSQVEAPL